MELNHLLAPSSSDDHCLFFCKYPECPLIFVAYRSAGPAAVFRLPAARRRGAHSPATHGRGADSLAGNRGRRRRRRQDSLQLGRGPCLLSRGQPAVLCGRRHNADLPGPREPSTATEHCAAICRPGGGRQAEFLLPRRWWWSVRCDHVPIRRRSQRPLQRPGQRRDRRFVCAGVLWPPGACVETA